MTKDDISALWDEITPKLFGYLVNTLRDRALAEDILQTTWLRAMEALPGFKEKEGGFSAWLFMIARNECRQHWRKQGREVPLDLDIHDRGEDDSSKEKDEDKILADQILSQLSSNDQELLRLRYISGLPFHSVAKILKINGVAARVRMHRAMSHARELLKSQSIKI